MVGKEPRVATVINNAMLEAILAEIRPLIGRGKVADYIPALASVSGDKPWYPRSVRWTVSTLPLAMPMNVFPSSQSPRY
ncbi:glutaminase [Klebsiella pneumoniae]|uniref:Glutaminase n=1 Tax=Klebsiella pneumoniae TaxID=573 RepID=A0A377UZK8_KLEPN|nr:glutaminase [Klebsiella pneumoniae]